MSFDLADLTNRLRDTSDCGRSKIRKKIGCRQEDVDKPKLILAEHPRKFTAGLLRLGTWETKI